MIPNENCSGKRKAEPKDIDLTDGEDDEDDTMECSICSEDWTQAGPHRLVSLKCGHLYGEKCITRWMTRSKGSKAVCPHCKHPIKISDIRVVLPIKLGALDTAQIERFKSEISSTKAAIVERRYQLEKASLALSMTRRELEKRMAKLRLAKDGNDDALTLRSKPGRTLQHSRTDYLLTEDLGTRVMAIHQQSRSIFASTKRRSRYGVDIFSFERPGRVAYIPIHDGAIRDIKCRDDLLLSCGVDKMLKLISPKEQQAVQNISMEAPGWCCSFDPENSSLLYCGLANATTLVYDIRNTAKPLHRLQDRQKTGASPMYSLIPMTVGGKSTVLCGNLTKITAWDLDDTQCHVFDMGYSDKYKPYSLTRSEMDGSLLVSLRSHESSKHVIGRITDDWKLDISHTFDHTHQQKWVSKTVHFTDDDGRSLFCFANDEDGSLCIGGGDDDGQTARYPLGERIFDLRYCEFSDNDNRIVAALTSSKLHLYTFM